MRVCVCVWGGGGGKWVTGFNYLSMAYYYVKIKLAYACDNSLLISAKLNSASWVHVVLNVCFV